MPVLLPAIVGGMDGFPGTKRDGEIVPCATGPSHPEDALQHGPIGQGWCIAASSGRWEEPGDLLPERVVELARLRRQREGWDAVEDGRLRTVTALSMAAPRSCLMPPAKGRPPLTQATLAGWLTPCQHESPHFGDGEPAQTGTVPSASPRTRSCSVSCSRVTSSAACATRARVMKRYQAS